MSQNIPNFRPRQHFPTFSDLPTPIQSLILDHPHLTFQFGPRFTFRPPKTIIMGRPCQNFALLTLHEVGHALSNHKNYTTLTKLLKLELEAWERAKRLAPHYHIPLDQDFIEDHLDTYRYHLQAQATCPHCGLRRLETTSGAFLCPHCQLTPPLL